MAPKAAPPPDDEEGEVDPYAEVKVKAFRAVVKDDVASLNEVTSSVSADIWNTWQNKGGRNLVAMAKERNGPGVHAALVSSLMASPQLVSGGESMNKVFDALSKCYTCNPEIITLHRDLKCALAEVPTEIWSTWRNDCGQSLLTLARESGPCYFCDCRYADIPEEGNQFCSTGRGHIMGRPGALEIVTQEISLAKEELKRQIDVSEVPAGDPLQLTVRLLSASREDPAAGLEEEAAAAGDVTEDAQEMGEIVEIPVERGITVGDFRSRFAEARGMHEELENVMITCHDRVLDEDANDLPIEWWTAWGEGDGIVAILPPAEPCETAQMADDAEA